MIWFDFDKFKLPYDCNKSDSNLVSVCKFMKTTEVYLRAYIFILNLSNI